MKIDKEIPVRRRIRARLSVALVLTGLRSHGKEEIRAILEAKRKGKRWLSRHQNVCEHVAGGDEGDTEPKKDSVFEGKRYRTDCCSQQRRVTHNVHNNGKTIYGESMSPDHPSCHLML